MRKFLKEAGKGFVEGWSYGSVIMTYIWLAMLYVLTVAFAWEFGVAPFIVNLAVFGSIALCFYYWQWQGFIALMRESDAKVEAWAKEQRGKLATASLN